MLLNDNSNVCVAAQNTFSFSHLCHAKGGLFVVPPSSEWLGGNAVLCLLPPFKHPEMEKRKEGILECAVTVHSDGNGQICLGTQSDG